MFWERIQSLCEENNTTPTAMAKKLNLSTSMVTRWKDGTEPTPRILIMLAKHFGVSTDYLLGISSIRSLDEERNDDFDVANIVSHTGLSEKSIKVLAAFQKFNLHNAKYGIKGDNVAQVINHLIENLAHNAKVAEALVEIANLERGDYDVLAISEELAKSNLKCKGSLLTALGMPVPDATVFYELKKQKLLAVLKEYIENTIMKDESRAPKKKENELFELLNNQMREIDNAFRGYDAL